MRKMVALTALLLNVLSAVNVEGQEEVNLKPNTISTISGYVSGFSTGVSWKTYTQPGIAKTFVQNKQGNTFYVIGGNGTTFPYLPVSFTKLSGDYLVGRAQYMNEFSVAVFDLKNLAPEVQTPYGFQAHISSWAVFDSLTNFGECTFINRERRLVGVSHGDGVFIYELLGDTSPIQEIYSGVIWMASTPDGEYFAISNGIDVSLYAYDPAQDGYVLKARYLPEGYPDDLSNRYGSRMTLSTHNGELILVASDGGSAASDIRRINPLTGAVVGKVRVAYGTVTCAEQQYALFGQQGKIVHLPSGQAIGKISTNGGQFLGSILLSGDGRKMELFTAENIYGEGVADTSYLSEYAEEMLEAQYQVSQLEANWGTVIVYGSPWIFKGGSYRFVVVAQRNKKIGKLSYSSVNTKRVKTAKNKGGWILDLSNVQTDVLVQAEFVAMTPANKKARKKVVTGNPIFLWGLSERKAKISYLLLNGNYLGWDEYEYEYSIVVSDSGVEVTWYKVENQVPDRTKKSTLFR